MHFKEDFLHYVWRFRLFISPILYCTNGQSLEILHPGVLNTDAGPDFSRAKLKIGGTTWVGNVEIHLRSSDWFLHNHQHDAVYDAVILHVILIDDKPVCRKDGSMIPSFVLRNLYSESLLQNYTSLLNSVNIFPCEKQIGEVDSIFINGFLSRVIVERFEQKSIEIYHKLQVFKGNWDRVFYYYLARSFGFKVNSLPFEMLAASLPQRILAKHRDQPLQIEALIFGQAGFLKQSFCEAYPVNLQNEYTFLQRKYSLRPVEVSVWKFLRMRPKNFPTIRLAQFAALMINNNQLFSKFIEIKEITNLQLLFKNLPINSYWETHYHFGRPTALINNQLGRDSIYNILINTVCLFLFAYGKYINDRALEDRAFEFLEQLPAEKNSIILKYQGTGIKIDNALKSQSVLQLNKNYCSQKKCLNCVIGNKLLNK